MKIAVVSGNAVTRSKLRAALERGLDPAQLDVVELDRAQLVDALARPGGIADRVLVIDDDARAPGLVDSPAPSVAESSVWARITARMGLCPSFFTLAGDRTDVASALFDFTEQAFLDSPLPDEFKRKLFIHLSRFCPVPYCLARHCGFLIMQRRKAGAAATAVAEVCALLEAPLPSADQLELVRARLEAAEPWEQDWPSWDSPLGHALRDACTEVFLRSDQTPRWLAALRRTLGRGSFEQLALFLSFIRTAHSWTELHPGLEFEADLRELLREQQGLADMLAAASERALPRTDLERRLTVELDELRGRVEETRRIRRLADALPALVSYVDADRRYVFLNRQYTEQFERPAADLVGRKVAEVLDPETYAEVEPKLGEALRGERVRTELSLAQRDGSVRQFDATLVPDRRADETVAGCFVMAVDITERKQAELHLRRSEERLRMAKDAAGIGIHDYDMRRQIIEWDERVRELLGVGESVPITRELYLSRVHPDDRPKVVAAVERALDPASGGHYRIEHRVLASGRDEARWVAVTGQTTFADGQAIRAVGTVHDITERKLGEQALHRSKERLRESDRRKDEFLAMLGHELRNPLAAIRSASELLGIYCGDDPRLNRIRAVLDRQSKHMGRLIDGLLEVSRIARGKIALEGRVLDLREVLTAVVEDRRDQLAQAGLALDLQLAREPLWVWGDEVRLAQVFDNLLGNAIKFTRVGRVEVVARREDETVVVAVRDTGVGIEEGMLELIFEAFEQASHALEHSAGGLGLGLALVRGLVGLHRGSVVARSEGPGTGAEFEVRLPAAELEVGER